MLTIFEQLFLLAIHEEKGNVMPSLGTALGFGLSGAVIAELALQGRITIENNHRLVRLDSSPTGDNILDDALAEILASGNNRKITYWIRNITEKPKRFRERLSERLVTKGIVTEEDTIYAWVIPNPEFPEVNASGKYWLKTRLRQIIFTGQTPELRDLAFLCLVKSCGLTDLVFLKDERKIAQQRINEYLLSMALTNPMAQSLEEIGHSVETLVESD
jgi:golgi phosphoprotein 3